MRAKSGYVFYGQRGIPLTETSLANVPPFDGDLSAYAEPFRRWSKKYLNWAITPDRTESVDGAVFVSGDGVTIEFEKEP